MIARKLLIKSAWALVVLLPSGAVALVSSMHAAPSAIARPKSIAAPVRAPTPVRPAAKAPAAAAPAVAANDFTIKRVLEGGAPIRYGNYLWDDAGVPAGPIVITIDLTAETLSVFQGGYEIGATAILFGDGKKQTPLGTFSITEKDADHISNIYHAPMPYMLRLTSDGISIHGSEVEWGYATHGCIGVPTAFAKRLFAIAKLADRVIITRGKRRVIGAPTNVS